MHWGLLAKSSRRRMELDECNSSAAAKSKAPPIVGDVCTRAMGPDYEHRRHRTDHCSKEALGRSRLQLDHGGRSERNASAGAAANDAAVEPAQRR